MIRTDMPARVAMSAPPKSITGTLPGQSESSPRTRRERRPATRLRAPKRPKQFHLCPRTVGVERITFQEFLVCSRPSEAFVSPSDKNATVGSTLVCRSSGQILLIWCWHFVCFNPGEDARLGRVRPRHTEPQRKENANEVMEGQQ